MTMTSKAKAKSAEVDDSDSDTIPMDDRTTDLSDNESDAKAAPKKEVKKKEEPAPENKKRGRKRKKDVENSDPDNDQARAQQEMKDRNVHVTIDPNKTYYCFHKRCMDAYATFAELRAHCAEDHNYTGSLRCGRCHSVMTNEELYETHKSTCTNKFQCVDCGRTFAPWADYATHVARPWCDRQADYKLMYHQTSRLLNYSFSKTETENTIETHARSKARTKIENAPRRSPTDEDSA